MPGARNSTNTQAMVDIFSLNQLIRTTDGPYVAGEAAHGEFAYSDGAETEQYLYQVLTEATDLSSRSPQLQQKIIDWPSEYHLSSDRSNLLRPFNLDSVSTVLELGSGCGAISRYLGEQGKLVDAVEGSRVRANLGKLRCRDLDNVRVINANYNDLVVPQGHYDLILFIGVIEYAHKFHPDADSDYAAANMILERAKTHMKPDGVVMVAIENRLGLKYMLGAHEDHYARRYIGINGYRHSAGISTYSRQQWDQLVDQAGFSDRAFSYPFPDYKIPRVLLAEEYVRHNAHASNHLEGMLSRDYFAPVKRSATESICWQAASNGGFIGNIANSFCILMGNDASAIERMQAFDFCHGPGSSRKNQFAVITTKPSGRDIVMKVPVCVERPDTGPVVTQQLAEQQFIGGTLLSAQWLRTILIYMRREEFEQELQEYYAFLGQKAQPDTLSIDLLPINILVDEAGDWQVFDQEWQVNWSLTKEYLLFRALLTFIVSNWVYLKDYLRWLELQTVRDFVEYGFHVNMIHLSENVDSFIDQENRFQKAIARDEDAQDVTALLATVFDFSEGNESIFTSIYWRHGEQGFDETNKSTTEVIPGQELQQLRFQLPQNAKIDSIRIDPFDIRNPGDVGFYQLTSLQIGHSEGGQNQVHWSLQGAESIASACRASSAVYSASGEHASWIATTDFPKMEFDLPTLIAADPDCPLYLDIDLRIARTMEYTLAYNHYLVTVEQAKKTGTRALQNLQSMKVVNDFLVAKAESLEINSTKTIAKLENDLAITRTEIKTIKAGRPFRLAAKIISLLAPLQKLAGRK